MNKEKKNMFLYLLDVLSTCGQKDAGFTEQQLMETFNVSKSSMAAFKANMTMGRYK